MHLSHVQPLKTFTARFGMHIMRIVNPDARKNHAVLQA